MSSTSRVRKDDRSTSTRPSGVSPSTLPAQTVETAKASWAAACSSAEAFAATKRGFSYSAITFAPMRRKTRILLWLIRARSRPTGAEPRPVFNAVTYRKRPLTPAASALGRATRMRPFSLST